MDIPILKYLDVLIGLAFVMVLGCTVVTAATQLITSSLYLRAQYLREGLANLLQQLDPSASGADCQYAAQLMQRHPLVCRTATLPGELTTWLRRKLRPGATLLPSGAPADTVQRHEFVRILLEWASGQGVLANLTGMECTDAQRARITKIMENLRGILARDGVQSAGETLAAIRQFAVAQEQAFPERPAHLWQTMALLQACPAEFIGKVTGWYDAMSARTSERFGLQSKLIGGLVAVFVVYSMNLDSIRLVKGLSDDPGARQKLVELAQARVKAGEAGAQVDLDQAKQELQAALAPLDIGGATANSSNATNSSKWAGLVLSWILLSLGAPFWYDLLKNLFKLRSVIAQKDDKERADRETAGAVPGAGTGAAELPAAGTEVGVIAVRAVPDVRDDEAGELEELEVVG